MADKVNLAMQNQYVEFAKKDGEGKDIAEGFKALMQEIEGKIGFDMDIECGHGPYAIPANTFNESLGTSNVPCIVRLKATGSSKPFGVALVTPSAQNYNIIYMFQGNIYKKSGLSYGSSYTLGSDDDALAKSIYWHGLDLYNGSKSNLAKAHILNNSDEAIDSATKLVAWFNSIEGRVDLDCIGTVDISGVHYQLISIVKNAQGAFFIYYADSNGYHSVNNIDLTDYFVSINDSTNRIN